MGALSKRYYSALAIFLTVPAWAQSNSSALQLPESSVEEYRIESQYGPDKAVLNPKFSKEERVELGAGFGYSGSSSVMKYTAATGSLVYHLSQRHAIEPVWFSYTWAKKSDFVNEQIAAKRPAQGSRLSVELPRMLMAASYQYTPFYSKMHITERSVAHFDLYFGLGVGFVQEEAVFLNDAKGEKKMRPGVSLATGLRFFLPPRWALRFEMRDLIHRSENFGAQRTANNVQLSASLNVFFGRFPKLSE